MNFPIDFFEHNQQLTDVEFGGNDLLQVYNAQQIKHRLNSTGMYVANTKVSGAIWDSLGLLVLLLFMLIPCLALRSLLCSNDPHKYCNLVNSGGTSVQSPWLLS